MRPSCLRTGILWGVFCIGPGPRRFALAARGLSKSNSSFLAPGSINVEASNASWGRTQAGKGIDAPGGGSSCPKDHCQAFWRFRAGARICGGGPRGRMRHRDADFFTFIKRAEKPQRYVLAAIYVAVHKANGLIERAGYGEASLRPKVPYEKAAEMAKAAGQAPVVRTTYTCKPITMSASEPLPGEVRTPPHPGGGTTKDDDMVGRHDGRAAGLLQGARRGHGAVIHRTKTRSISPRRTTRRSSGTSRS